MKKLFLIYIHFNLLVGAMWAENKEQAEEAWIMDHLNDVEELRVILVEDAKAILQK